MIFNKKGDIDVDTLVKIGIWALVVVIAFIAIGIFFKNLDTNVAFLKNLFRFK